MKYALFLLAVVVGTAFGKNELGAEIQGYNKKAAEICSTDVMDELYELCVETPALELGAELTRHLTLRGNRDLIPCSLCLPNPHMGQWCYVKCGGRRRLAVPDDHVNKGQIQKAANNCFDEKAQDPTYACLGDKSKIKIKIFFD
jgi:hypothetical protein